MSYQREYTKKLKVGFIGLGSHMYRNLVPAAHFLPVEVTAVCSRNEGYAKSTAEQYRCPYYLKASDMYKHEGLDAVFIAVSPQAHPGLVIEALEAGLHVWVEKPVSILAEDVERMMEKRKDKVVVAGFKKAFMPATRKAIEIINSQKYGNLRSILAVYPMTIPDNGEEVLEKRLFTNWLGNGCHPLSLMIAAGGEAGAVMVHKNSSGNGICILEFKNGVIGNFHMASGPHPVEQYCFYGDTWHLAIQNGDRVVLQRGIPFEYSKTNNFAPEGDDSGAIVWEPQNCLSTLENKSLFIQGVVNEMKYFCDCILEGKRAEIGSLEFALSVMKVYEAALKSHGKTIYL